MNMYVLAFIALIFAFAVGFVVYGQIFKGPLGTADEKIDPMHLGIATVTIYLSCLAFIYLFDHTTMGTMTGVSKGVSLGLITGIGIFALPLIADAGFFRAKKEALQAVSLNWIVSFAVIGLVVGWLR
jgi:hypothetical protein